MTGITGFALNNSRTVIMTTLLVVIGGVYAFMNLPKLEDPYITIREAVVMASYPGMPVEQVERLITRPIEEEIRSMGEVDEIVQGPPIPLPYTEIDGKAVEEPTLVAKREEAKELLKKFRLKSETTSSSPPTPLIRLSLTLMNSETSPALTKTL